MIYVFKQIGLIVKKGIKSLFIDIDGNERSKSQFIIFLVLFPVLIFMFIFWKNLKLSDSIDTILTVLSIFTALIFGVIFTVPDKLSQRIELYKNSKEDAKKNYLVRFCNFTKSFVEQISLIIIICIVLIVLLIILKTTDKFTAWYIHKIQIIITAFSTTLFYYLLIYILVLLTNIYILLMDDIRINKDSLN